MVVIQLYQKNRHTISAVLERYELKYIQGGVCKLVLSPASQI